VCGTTGWLESYDEIVEDFEMAGAPLLYASNFSVGVNIFFELNKKLAQLMQGQSDYDISMEESHHITKKDAPSGTAATLANQVIEINPEKTGWTLSENPQLSEIPIKAIREGDVKGTHIVKYTAGIDEISIKHEAFTRKGFALGALLGAEYIYDKSGLHDMKSVLGL